MITLTDHATRRCSVSCSFFLLFGFLFVELICFFVVVLCSGARSFQINWMIFQTDDDVILFVHFFHRDFRVTVFSVWQSGTSETTVFSVRLFCPCRLKVQHISYRKDNDTLLESTKFSQYNKPKTTAWKKNEPTTKDKMKKRVRKKLYTIITITPPSPRFRSEQNLFNFEIFSCSLSAYAN